jgi:hypothetical protein
MDGAGGQIRADHKGARVPGGGLQFGALWAALSMATVTGAVGGVADLASDWISPNNPNGLWTYGSTPTLGGAFTRFACPDRQVTGLEGWGPSEGGLDSFDYNPKVFFNAGQASLEIITLTVPPGLLVQHPANDGSLSVVRWSAPATAEYTVDASFVGLDGSGSTTTTDVHVLKGGIQIFGGEVSGQGDTVTLPTSALMFDAGETLDFAVGYGSDMDFQFDSTVLEASIEGVSNAAGDWVSPALPSGEWTYGSVGFIGGTLQVYRCTDITADGVEAWGSSAGGILDNAFNPQAFFNPTAASVEIVSLTIGPGEVALQPGESGDLSSAWWTAPVPGNYTLEAAFRGLDGGGSTTTTDVHVVLNGFGIFNDVVIGQGDTAAMAPTTRALSAGDTVDFMVGWGTDLDFQFDSTGVSATVTREPVEGAGVTLR